MSAPDRVAIGRVGRSHGLDGSFVVEGASEDERWFAVGARFLAGGEPAEVVSSKRSGGRRVIKLDRPIARGVPLEVDRSDLPPTAEDEYYAVDLIGLEVVEDGGRVLGTVKDVLPGVANDVLELDTALALPMVEDCVRDIDLASRRILVAPGFADLPR